MNYDRFIKIYVKFNKMKECEKNTEKENEYG